MYGHILEEELKNKVAADLFGDFDTTQIIGRVDFCVALPADPVGLNEPESLLWAEAKSGTRHDIFESLIQLILTLGRERPQDRILPPAFLGAFDAEKIAFLPYAAALDVLRQNDFNWNVAPSDHTTKEFRQLKAMLDDALHSGLEIYRYEADARELMRFIRHNFTLRKAGVRHIRINKNNFTHIYLKWLEAVKPTININWEMAKRAGIIDADFYLADILSKENHTLGEKLFVLLQDDHYLLDRRVDDLGLENFTRATFNDKQRAHRLFWNRYARPPRREYWDHIVNRRDLLVPQDVRERKGSFFTPARWVELSQQYIAAELGEDWQEKYYVWDCCAGTGNLLAGLTNKYNVYASTLDRADVQAMHQRIEAGANLLPSHVFQFDFLNDSFDKLPDSLQDIINDPNKRRRLVVYINPPYAEAGTATQVTGSGENKTGVSNNTAVWKQYKSRFGLGIRELYVQFFARIYDEIPTCILAEFSKLKILQGTAFQDFRNFFQAKPGRNFCVPAYTFDNVKGHFPIGFFIWHTGKKEMFKSIVTDVYKADGEFLCKKTISIEGAVTITKWIAPYMHAGKEKVVGYTGNNGPDYQNNQYLYITSKQSLLKSSRPNNETKYSITRSNLQVAAIYFTVRLHQLATWLNDRDQFLYPTDGWQTDWEFQADCLVYTLFHGQNRISASTNDTRHLKTGSGPSSARKVHFLGEEGALPTLTEREALAVNHWIPFTEEEVGAQERFASHFMSDLLRQPLNIPRSGTDGAPSLFDSHTASAERMHQSAAPPTPLQAMSREAQAVMQAGCALWRYYHEQRGAAPDASFYDIRLHFQGTKTTKSGKVQMNPDSADAEYTRLIGLLREAQKELAAHIEPKVYLYGFLKQ